MSKIDSLTIRFAQKFQPWDVPYSPGVMEAQDTSVPHILGSHCVLHAIKSLGRIASVFEQMDHSDENFSAEQRSIVRSMSADLMTASMRFANLLGFDLAEALVERVAEKNARGLPDWTCP